MRVLVPSIFFEEFWAQDVKVWSRVIDWELCNSRLLAVWIVQRGGSLIVDYCERC